jgi:hypothetical protein
MIWRRLRGRRRRRREGRVQGDREGVVGVGVEAMGAAGRYK